LSARIQIDQVGLPAGVAGLARTDGLDTGALVTLTDTAGAGNSTFHLLWGPPDDLGAEASLAPTGDPNVWEFAPASGSEGSYVVELRENAEPVERRVFGVRTAAKLLLIPAFAERASRHAGWSNDGIDQSELSDNNALDYGEASLNVVPYAGWWRTISELYRIVEAGTGGPADHSLPLVKLEPAPSQTVVANPLDVAGDAQYFAGTAALQRLRVNVANDGLEWSTPAAQGSTSIVYNAAANRFERGAVAGAVTLALNSNASTFTAAAAKSVLINAANGSAVPAFVAGTGALQYLRVNAANNGLEWATLTIPTDFVTNTILANMAANTVKVNATAAPAAPTDLAMAAQSVHLRAAGNIVNLAASADGVLQRLASGNLGFSVLRGGLANDTTFGSVTASSAGLTPFGQYIIPAGSSAVGDRYEWSAELQFVRGATATALNVIYDASGMGLGVLPTVDLALPTVAGTYAIFVRGSLTITAIGAGGTARCELSAYGSGVLGVTSTSQFINTSLDTTANIFIQPLTRMGPGTVAGTTLSAWGGDVRRVR